MVSVIKPGGQGFGVGIDLGSAHVRGHFKTVNTNMDHTQWAAKKERATSDLRVHKKREEKRQAQQIKAAKRLAQAHFKKWLLRKTNYEKARSLLHDGIDATHARTDHDWKAVGTALAAVDLMLAEYAQTEQTEGHAAGRHFHSRKNAHPLANQRNRTSATPSDKSRAGQLRSLRDDFLKWSKGRAGDSRHSFQDVKVATVIAQRFTNQMQETMEEYARSFNFQNKTEHAFVLSSLSYTPPLGRKPRNELEEVQEVQTRILNRMWMHRFTQDWKECEQRVLLELDSATASSVVEAKADIAEVSKNSDDTLDSDYDGDGMVSTAERVRKKILYGLGLARLIKMQHGDRAAVVLAKKEEEIDRRDRGLASHAAWSRKKGNCMIQMPSPRINPYTGKPVKANPPPRMDFSGRGVARAKARTVMQNSVDIMMGTGMKYIHAMGHAKQPGQMRDLERSRESLIKSGFISKRNFIAVNDAQVNDGDVMTSALHTAKEANPTLQRRGELESVKRDRNDRKQHERWAAQKQRHGRAVQYLGLLETPYEGESKNVTDGERDRKWRDIGRLVKGVDVNLLSQWATWSKSYKSFGECQRAWKTFPPAAREEGTTGFAALAKRTLLKIFSNRRDYDWHSAFDEFTEKKLAKWTAAFVSRRTLKPPPKSTETLFAKLALKVGINYVQGARVVCCEDVFSLGS